MKIETKFNVGQDVWIIFNNQPETWRVTEIIITPIKQNSYSVRYKLHHVGNTHLGGVHETELWEYQIGATKRALLESFLDDKD